jgi:DNA-directed RNA polymerase subunit RPC12/RpoP
MSDSPERPMIPSYRCRDCGSEVGFRSRRRTMSERFLLPLLLLQPVRCGECFRRDYRLIFTAVRDRLADTPGLIPGKHPAASDHRNVA